MDYNIIFKLVDKVCDIHLGVADKLLLKNHLAELTNRGCNDIISTAKFAKEYLISMGYTSKQLADLSKRQNKFEKDFAEYCLDRYKK